MPMTTPYHLRSRTKAAGNSEPMLAHSAAIAIDGEPGDPSGTLSPYIDEESLDDPFRTPSPDLNEEPLDHPFRTPYPDIDGEPSDNIPQMLAEVTDLPFELRSSPLSEVSLSLPSFSSLSPNRLPLRTIGVAGVILLDGMMHCLRNLEAMGMEDLMYMPAQNLMTEP